MDSRHLGGRVADTYERGRTYPMWDSDAGFSTVDYGRKARGALELAGNARVSSPARATGQNSALGHRCICRCPYAFLGPIWMFGPQLEGQLRPAPAPIGLARVRVRRGGRSLALRLSNLPPHVGYSVAELGPWGRGRFLHGGSLFRLGSLMGQGDGKVEGVKELERKPLDGGHASHSAHGGMYPLFDHGEESAILQLSNCPLRPAELEVGMVRDRLEMDVDEGPFTHGAHAERG